MPASRPAQVKQSPRDAVPLRMSRANSQAPSIPQGRDFALDAARAILMLLGIVLHGAMAYSPGGEWMVTDPQGSPGFYLLGQTIHLFRLPAFFWISGYFFALTMSRSDSSAQLGRRLLRLVVPLAVTWVTFNVAQEWLIARLTHGTPREPVPVGHLWFLVDLTVLTLVAAAAMHLPASVMHWLKWPFAVRLTVPRLFIILTLYTTVIMLAVRASRVGFIPLAHITTLARVATYLPFFAAGIAMYHLPNVRRVFLQVPAWLALLALPVGVVAQSFRRDHGVVAELALPTETLMVWILIAVVLQQFYLFVRRESRSVRLLSDSCYSIYLFHHAIMVGLVFLLLAFPLPAVLKFLVVCLVSFAAAAALHVFAVQRIPVLRLLFNGIMPRKSRASGARPVARAVEARSMDDMLELPAPVRSAGATGL